MGTKNKPGKYDCYDNLDPDEPYFVLMGRDKHAPLLVRMWAMLRALDGEKQPKVDEANSCALHMELFRSARVLAEKKEKRK
jgi:hypothetical protein